ncbi:adp-glucose pyrophosphorylase signature 2 [Lucifera butyrica]|uniref:Glucose-1-phosphate adenylyltransferase n=2 Tax=Lucifera butyrica TaxID=1351585 RepID=A0A498R141_9FIRM|nr:adp-glucose pyrophosphorylase signature 2 [Lucifera butyrica]
MVLAGGQGSRLGILTKNLAKPAVPFGGKYRIIDFTLSNCYNSRIDTVGVLTQYQPLALNSYIGVGSPWDLERLDGGLFLLPPYMKEKGGEWYKGTANAVYQNIRFIEQYDPDYVLVLSGDHVYTMDYSAMLSYHKQKQAEATISVIEVPWEEAGRFGIMNADRDGKIAEFEEKPKKPKTNLASMGVYVFNWNLLKRYLQEDEQDPHSSHDFGKNIIPKMLHNGQRMLAYPFKGYWKDVGTVESLWEANMDLLCEEPLLDMYNEAWPIYCVNPVQPPHYVNATGRVCRSMIGGGCLVYGEVDHSVLFPGVSIGEGSKIRDCVIMPNARIGAGVHLERAIIGEESIVEDGCQIGCEEYADSRPHQSDVATGLTIIGENILIPQNCKIQKNTVVSPENWEQDQFVHLYVV